jgi:tetratricopeptide (TPR) repeat protein
VAVAGYFVPGPMNYIAILADRDYDYSDVIFHEYVHVAAERALGDMPLWLGEGLAEFYSSFQPVDGGRKARIGTAYQGHLSRLQREFMPLATLAAVDHQSPYYNERDKSSIFYAESWALLHFLRIGADGKYAARLASFLEGVLDGLPFERACVERLGTTLQALEGELRQYLSSLYFKHLDVPLPEALGRIERLEATPVIEAEAHAQLAQLLLAVKAPDDARAHLDHAVGVDPGQPLALARLADLAAEAGKYGDALPLAQRAGQAASPTYLSQYYRASAIDRSSRGAGADLAAVVAAWLQVVTLNPSLAEGHARLAQARADTGTELELARQAQQRALALAPAREEYRLGLARILIMLGDTKAARGILGPLAARGATPVVKTTARNYLGVAAQVELARQAGDDVPVPERPPDTPGGPEDSTASTSASASRATADRSLVRPAVRPVQDGEVRIAGTMTAIECATSSTRIVMQTTDGAVRVRGARLDLIDFVSFRSDITGGISCGLQPQAPAVLVTYRPGRQGDTVGEVIIVEVVPVGFKVP